MANAHNSNHLPSGQRLLSNRTEFFWSRGIFCGDSEFVGYFEFSLRFSSRFFNMSNSASLIRSISAVPNENRVILELFDSSDDESDVEEVFEVKRILDARYVTVDRIEYFVEWLGFHECTWEEAWRLEDCKEAIWAFHSQQDEYVASALKAKSE